MLLSFSLRDAGTLFVFFMVACAVLWQRYLPSSSDDPPWALGAVLCANILLALGEAPAALCHALHSKCCFVCI